MSKEERSAKIQALQMKNKRQTIVKELAHIIPDISLESFVGTEETLILSKSIYNKIDELSNKEEIPKDVEVAIVKLLTYKPLLEKKLDNVVVLFHKQDMETGALKIRLNDFFNNIQFMLEFVYFSTDYRDLLIVDEALKYGVCIERLEYHNIFIGWGL